MLTRLSAMLPLNVRGMWIGTFHGLCHRLLRAHWKLASLPQTFQILDSGPAQRGQAPVQVADRRGARIRRSSCSGSSPAARRTACAPTR